VRGLAGRGHHVEVVKIDTGPGPSLQDDTYEGVRVTVFRERAPDVPLVRNLSKNERLWTRFDAYLRPGRILVFGESEVRYLESLEFTLVRESLLERAQLLKTAPHLITPIRFLLPIYGWQRRQALVLRAGLALYDALSFGDGLPASGRLDDDDIAQLPRLRQEGLTSVLHYCDCLTDDARLTLSVLLDARARGADILNRRAVTAITPLANGYAVALDERGQKRSVEARFIVNAAGPWVARVDSLTEAAPPPRPLRTAMSTSWPTPFWSIVWNGSFSRMSCFR